MEYSACEHINDKPAPVFGNWKKLIRDGLSESTRKRVTLNFKKQNLAFSSLIVFNIWLITYSNSAS